MPTSLPTMDELIGNPGIDERNVYRALLELTESDQNQVYTLHAELEGGLLAPAFEALLAGWAAQGHQLVALATQFKRIDAVESARLPTLPLNWGGLAGRSGELIVASAP
jgi:hypothetical protein